MSPWNEERLPAEIRADLRETARRRGAPLPDSAPKIALGPRPTAKGAARRRVVGGKGDGHGG